ncbi:DNA mismatch repair protein MutS [Clostridiaceae bacterium UIB06]|uniref:DNA mismatch repair protein MutS n=1 Tax=Clostridium thailandense TaxID=2794346 RepID=A0A949WTZ2_9CLOT|nr:DNA mismatch repair protein MutS [Clostridium thailandense]MBV7276756.1 DNA mismatch repair protein MutS [Clostridium thailandense]MCH5137573.1 DNA mismatch repair protein MutS [Clostridiaceae bacterium UIB06]
MGLTPMMQQYLEVKESCKDCILFFRLGDFYEMFFEDAETASKELELVLTGRDCGLEKRAPMCGIPFHAANAYISRLVNKGYKIAICEQLEDPSAAKGIVKRGIIKVITPGTYMDSSFLEDNKNNYIMCLYINNEKSSFAISFADVSTGDFSCTDAPLDISVVLDEISKYAPKEILVQEELEEQICSGIKERFNTSFTKLSEEFFCSDTIGTLKNQFAYINEEEYSGDLIKCCGSLLKYIIETQKTGLSHINSFQYYSIVDYLSIDSNSRRNLELTENLREKNKKGSLLWIMDRTNTSMGARQLRRWIEQPLVDKISIQGRLDAVEELLNNLPIHEDLKEALKEIYDIERLVGKISSKSVNAKELISLKSSIEKIPAIKEIISSFTSNLFINMHKNLDELQDIYKILYEAILENPSISVKEGNLIKEGFNEEIDELRIAKVHGKEWIASLENNEREETGIKSLKVGYNKVFGYYIEITKSNLSSVPEGRYIRKQTLANAERYITPELKEMEDKILGAEEKLINLEYEIFVQIREKIETEVDRMQQTARIISELDCLSSLAIIALENNYCKPEINNAEEIYVQEGRHPVVEKMIPSGSFVSNDININTTNEQLLLITGPNMAGKSTYMRQAALIVIMAQIGSFVPAKKAVISVCDKIFTRIGASDDLAAGKSTFMVEMWEVSNILKNATNKSLILLDEVGRGTSTYDGLSIAWSVIEYICKNKKLKCKTLFATHYHELTKLEGILEGIKNYSVSVKEMGSDIVFLRKIIRGGADQSYGIEVAKLAGLPIDVINRAKEILARIEKEKSSDVNIEEITDKVNSNVLSKKNSEVIRSEQSSEIIREVALDKRESHQMNFIDIEKENLLKEISSIDILNMTPMDGFNKLYDIIKRTKKL